MKKNPFRGYNINIRSKDKASLLKVLNNLGDLNLQQRRLLLAERQLLEAGSIAKRIDDKQELLNYYGLMKTLDSTKRRFDRAFVWQREYFTLKNILSKENTTSNVIPEMNLDSELGVTETTDSENIASTNNEILSDSQEKMKRFKLLFYVLLGAIVLMGIFLFSSE